MSCNTPSTVRTFLKFKIFLNLFPLTLVALCWVCLWREADWACWRTAAWIWWEGCFSGPWPQVCHLQSKINHIAAVLGFSKDEHETKTTQWFLPFIFARPPRSIAGATVLTEEGTWTLKQSARYSLKLHKPKKKRKKDPIAYYISQGIFYFKIRIVIEYLESSKHLQKIHISCSGGFNRLTLYHININIFNNRICAITFILTTVRTARLPVKGSVRCICRVIRKKRKHQENILSS